MVAITVCRNASVSALFAVLSAVAYCADYSDYVSLDESDTVHTWNVDKTSFGTFESGHWSDDGIPAQGKKYYVPSGKELATPNVGGAAQSIQFAGDELVIAGSLAYYSKNDAVMTITNLVLETGGALTFPSYSASTISGRMTVLGDSSVNASFSGTTSDGGLNFVVDMDVAGDGALSVRGTPVSTARTFSFTGAFDDFSGSLVIGENQTFKFADDIAVENLTLEDGATLAFSSAGVAITVSGALALPGGKATISWGETISAAYDGSCVTNALIHLSSGTIDPDKFAMAPVEKTLDSLFPNVELFVANDEQSRSTLYFRTIPVVKHTTSATSASTSEFSDASKWTPSGIGVVSGYDYYSVITRYQPNTDYVFPGNSLTCIGSYFNKSGKSFTCDDLTLSGVSFTGRSGMTLNGNVNFCEGSTSQFLSFGGSAVIINAEVTGSGTVEFTSHGTAASSSRVSSGVMTALNTNFTGRIVVTHEMTAMPNGDDAANKTNTWLVVSDARNLGGALESFDYDSLTLEMQSVVSNTCDVTFDEATRGLLIEGEGRFVVADETTLALNQQITYNGLMRKSGTGVLSLGGSALFTDGEASSLPQDGKNVLKVDEGLLKVTSTNALDGVVVQFAAGTKLVIPARFGEDDGFTQKGIVNTKTDTPFSMMSGEGSIPVQLCDYDTDNWTSKVKRSAVATVNSDIAESVAEALSIEKPSDSPSGTVFAKEVISNGDGTSTIYATVKIVVGLIIVVR